MRHSVSLMIGILDPHTPKPSIASPVTVPCWFAAILLLIVGAAGLVDKGSREAAYQIGWLVRDIATWVDWVTLELGVWVGLPAPVMVWGVG